MGSSWSSSYGSRIHLYICNHCLSLLTLWDLRGLHRMVVGFTSTYTIIAYHYERCGIFVVFIVWKSDSPLPIQSLPITTNVVGYSWSSSYGSRIHLYIYNHCLSLRTLWDIRGLHRMVVGFTSTYTIIAYHYERCGIFVVFIVWKSDSPLPIQSLPITTNVVGYSWSSSYGSRIHLYLYNHCLSLRTLWDIRGLHRMVVGFTSTYTIIAYHY